MNVNSRGCEPAVSDKNRSGPERAECRWSSPFKAVIRRRRDPWVGTHRYSHGSPAVNNAYCGNDIECNMKEKRASEFERAAAAESRSGFLSELWGFLKTNKKWWLLPIIVVFLILALLILLSSTGLAPFIYTLF